MLGRGLMAVVGCEPPQAPRTTATTPRPTRRLTAVLDRRSPRNVSGIRNTCFRPPFRKFTLLKPSKPLGRTTVRKVLGWEPIVERTPSEQQGRVQQLGAGLPTATPARCVEPDSPGEANVLWRPSPKSAPQPRR